MKFTIQVFCTKMDDNGKSFRANFVYQGEGSGDTYQEQVGDFLKNVKDINWDDVKDVKFGAFMPGWHNRIP